MSKHSNSILPLLFLGAIILDFILPPLFGFQDNFFTMLFLIAAAAYVGLSRVVVTYGVIAGLAGEILLGFRFGTIALPFLMVCLFFFLLSRVVNISRIQSGPGSLGTVAGLAGLALAGVILFYVSFALAEIVWYHDPSASITQAISQAFRLRFLIVTWVSALGIMLVMKYGIHT